MKIKVKVYYSAKNVISLNSALQPVILNLIAF